jgi:Methyltransferase domain
MFQIQVGRRVTPFLAYELYHQPRVTVGYLWGAIRLESTLASFLGVSRAQLRAWWVELLERDRLYDRIRAREREIESSGQPVHNPGGRADASSEVLYLIVRAVRPQVVVETGVALGYSSAFILQGLHDNGLGHLHSIDLPTTDPGGHITSEGVLDRTSVPVVQTGGVIPNDLRDRWSLTLAPSNPTLEAIFGQVGPADIFFHDSEHTRENMIWEYRTSWPHLRAGGYLLSDDVLLNDAFPQFCREVGRPGYRWFGPGGRRGAVRHP